MSQKVLSTYVQGCVTVSIPGKRDFSPNPINTVIEIVTSFSFVDGFHELLRLSIEIKLLTIREP